jgi:dTDP-4-dehydrorhamnose reductase
VTALITGGGGQLAHALQTSAPEDQAVRALSHAELDIADEAAVQEIMRTLQPQLVIPTGRPIALSSIESVAPAVKLEPRGRSAQ